MASKGANTSYNELYTFAFFEIVTYFTQYRPDVTTPHRLFIRGRYHPSCYVSESITKPCRQSFTVIRSTTSPVFPSRLQNLCNPCARMWGRLPVKIFKKPLDQCGNVQGSAVLFADFLLVWKFVGHFLRKCVIISLQAISANVMSRQTYAHRW